MVRGPMSWSSPISVPSISRAISRIGNSGSGPADAHAEPRRRTAVRGSPARSVSTGARPARQSLAGQRDDRLALVRADLDERGPRRGERARQQVEEPGDHRQPVGSAIERLRRLERRRCRQADAIASERTYGQVRGDDVPRVRRPPTRTEVGHRERDPIAHPVSDRVLARQVQGVGRDVDGVDRDLVGGHAPRRAGPRRARSRSRHCPSPRRRPGTAPRRTPRPGPRAASSPRRARGRRRAPSPGAG